MSRKVLLLLALALLALATLAVSGAHAAAGGGSGAKGRGGGHGGGAKHRGGGHADAAGGAKHHGLFTEPDPHRLRPDVVVSQRDDDGNVTTITEALKLSEAAVNTRATEYFIIYVKAGTYTEHLTITASNVMLIGDGMGATFITGNLCKRQGYTTEQTATLTATGDGFMARDLAIYNTAGAPHDEQAVALSVSSDRSVFYRCDLMGFQDTLLAYKNTQFYRECRIWGTIDFIFGDAAAVFQDCYLYVRQPPSGKPGIITAHGGEYHDLTSGFIFQNCTVDISHLPGENLTGVLTYLGRPWRSHARVVFMLSSITSLIHADGWIAWNETHQTGGKAPGPDHVNHTYFASYQNRDLDSNKPVIWHNFTEITSDEAKKFTPQRFLHAKKWLRATGVPCYLGLGPVPLPLPRSQLEY